MGRFLGRVGWHIINAQPSGVAVDTMVISRLFDDRTNRLADRYRTLIGATAALLAFHTVMELPLRAIESCGTSTVLAGAEDVSGEVGRRAS